MRRLLIGILISLATLTFLYISLVTWGADWYMKGGPCGTEKVHTAITEIYQIAYEADEYEYTFDHSHFQQDLFDDMLIKNELLLDRARKLKVPLCLQGTKDRLVRGLQGLVERWKAQAQGAEASEIKEILSTAITDLSMIEGDVEEIQQCAPYCESAIFSQLFLSLQEHLP
jgi:hypothetical protein